MPRKALGILLVCLVLLGAIAFGYWDMLSSERARLVQGSDTESVAEAVASPPGASEATAGAPAPRVPPEGNGPAAGSRPARPANDAADNRAAQVDGSKSGGTVPASSAEHAVDGASEPASGEASASAGLDHAGTGEGIGKGADRSTASRSVTLADVVPTHAPAASGEPSSSEPAAASSPPAGVEETAADAPTPPAGRGGDAGRGPTVEIAPGAGRDAGGSGADARSSVGKAATNAGQPAPGAVTAGGASAPAPSGPGPATSASEAQPAKEEKQARSATPARRSAGPTGDQTGDQTDGSAAQPGRQDRVAKLKQSSAPGTAGEPSSGDAAVATGKAVLSAPGGKAPTYEIVRVEPDGSAVIAGRATPNAEVELHDDSGVVGRDHATRDGDFVLMPQTPLGVGQHTLRLVEKLPDGTTRVSRETAIVNVPEKGRTDDLLAMIDEPDRPSRIVSLPGAGGEQTGGHEQTGGRGEGGAVALKETASPEAGKGPDTAGGGPAELPAQKGGYAASAAGGGGGAAADKDARGPGAASPYAVMVPEGVSNPAAPGAGERPTQPSVLRVEAVEIDGDNVYVAGSAKAGRRVRIYVDNDMLAETRASKGDRFLATGKDTLSIGRHMIRADEIGSGSEVVARAEVPFMRPEGDTAAAVSPAARLPNGGGAGAGGGNLEIASRPKSSEASADHPASALSGAAPVPTARSAAASVGAGVSAPGDTASAGGNTGPAQAAVAGPGGASSPEAGVPSSSNGASASQQPAQQPSGASTTGPQASPPATRRPASTVDEGAPAGEPAGRGSGKSTTPAGVASSAGTASSPGGSSGRTGASSAAGSHPKPGRQAAEVGASSRENEAAPSRPNDRQGSGSTKNGEGDETGGATGRDRSVASAPVRPTGGAASGAGAAAASPDGAAVAEATQPSQPATSGGAAAGAANGAPAQAASSAQPSGPGGSSAAPQPSAGEADRQAMASAEPGLEPLPEGVPVNRQPALSDVDGRVIIRRGDTLWAISRETYGRGIRFTVIYLANGDQIRDPDLIYPGQVFRLPKADQDGTSAPAEGGPAESGAAKIH